MAKWAKSGPHWLNTAEIGPNSPRYSGWPKVVQKSRLLTYSLKVCWQLFSDSLLILICLRARAASMIAASNFQVRESLKQELEEKKTKKHDRVLENAAFLVYL